MIVFFQSVVSGQTFPNLIGCYESYTKCRSALYCAQGERKRDGSEIIVVALKFAMSSHFLLPKNVHSAFYLSQIVIIVAMKLAIAMSSHFLLLKTSHSLFCHSQRVRQIIEELTEQTIECTVAPPFFPLKNKKE